MAGQRQAKDTPLQFAPGVVSNLTDRDATNRYKASNRVRWHKGLPEKVGGWIRQTLVGANNGVYIGVARALHDWSSLDTQQWIGIGSNCKLYLINNGRLSDITPMRKASNLSAPLSVTIGSPTITVTDPDHRARTGDHITITATAPIGGFDVSGVYDIASIPTPDSFTVTFSQNFNSTAVGGGSVTIEYDISCGLAENGELLGYGTGLYGAGTYGTPRPVGSGVPARMRTWSLDNWGEDLLAAPSDGELYWWDRTLGPNSRAALVAEAPAAIQRMLVNGSIGHVILLGCTNIDGTPDPMRIRWCEQENFRQWDPQLYQTAGGKRLDKGSRIVTGIVSRSTNYVWTDTMLYSLQYVGRPDIYVPVELGTMKIVGPNAAADVNGIAFSMAFDDFMIYDGTLRPMICELHTAVFGDEGRNIEGKFDRTQAEAVYCSTYLPKNEVTWHYPGTDGLTYYITYNTVLQCWYGGLMERTAYHDVSEAITGYKTNPYGVNGGYLYKHEVGTDEVEGATTTPQAWYLETYDINAGGSDGIFIINHLIPNFDRFRGGMQVRLKKKTKPRQPTYQARGPYTCLSSTMDLDVRCKASQVAIRFESRGQTGEDWRMGVWQINATPYGGRMGAHIADPPVIGVLSGERQGNADDGYFNHLTWTAATAGEFPIAEYQVYDAATDFLLETTALLTYDHGPPLDAGTYEYYVVAYDTEGQASEPSNVVSLDVPESSDPYFASVVTLLTGDTGAIVEWSGGTTVDVEGSCALSTAQIKFGSHSIRNPDIDSPVDETDGIVITDPVTTSRFTFPGEFTLEGWFYPVDLSTDADQSLLIGNDAAVSAQRFVFDVRTDVGLGDAGRLRFRSGSTTVTQSAAGVLVVDQWQHLAVTRDALGIVRIFHQGIVVATSSTFSSSIGGLDSNGDANLKVTIGIPFIVGDLDTYFDQIRVTAGVCRYNANFTPPVEPFPHS